MQIKSVANADASVAPEGKVATDGQLQVFKVYPLDNRPIVESQSWISIVQVLDDVKKRILLRYGLHHRFISATAALRLLSATDRKDLSAILNALAKHSSATNRALNTPRSNVLEQAQQDAVRHTINHIIQQNIINNIRQQHLRQQRLSVANNRSQTTNDAVVSAAPAKALQNKVLQEAALGARTENVIYLTQNNHHVFYANAESEIAIEALLNSIRLRSGGSIKVAGTENFRRLAWLQAAALGMYIEGYTYTEADKRALYMRTDISDHANIKSSYMPTKAFQNVVMKAINGKNALKHLSTAERNYLLQRMRQNIVDNSQQHQL